MMKIVQNIKTFLWSENGIHLLKGTIGLLICVASFSAGLSNKACPLQPQLPFWIFGTSGFLFLANVVSLIVKNVRPVISWLKNIKKRRQNVGRFLDHVHGFFYSTFLIWVIPGFQWVHKSRKSFEYTSKLCDSNIKSLSLLLLFLLCLEVFFHFQYFLFHLFKQFKLKEISHDPNAQELVVMGETKNSSNKNSLRSRVPKKGTQENTGSTNAGLGDSRENLETGKVSHLSKIFESVDEESQRTTNTKPPVKFLPHPSSSIGKYNS